MSAQNLSIQDHAQPQIATRTSEPEEPCHCGYEEGRSYADKFEHEENCIADGDRAWDSFRDNATDEEMAAFVKEQEARK